MTFKTTALMLNENGSVYHLQALPGEIAPIIILVGDPDRTHQIAQHFSSIEIKRFHREFIFQTGWYNKKRITVIGTGIGSSNIDIVMNEIDALVNIDFARNTVKPEITQLKIIRLGTAGALQKDIPLKSYVISTAAFSFDGLLNYYQPQPNELEQKLLIALREHFHDTTMQENLYLSEGDPSLIRAFQPIALSGITFSCIGFYGPQYRQLRIPIAKKNLLQESQRFSFRQQCLMNFEMETAAIYGLGKLFNHQCCSLSLIVNNRVRDEKLVDAKAAMESMIEQSLEIISTF